MKTYLLYHQPGDQFKVLLPLHCLCRIQQFAAAPAKQIGGIFLTKLRHDGLDGFVQQGGVGLHVLAVPGLKIEQLAQLGIGRGLALAQGAKDVEHLLGGGKVVVHGAVDQDVDQKKRAQGVDGFLCFGRLGFAGAGHAGLTQAVDYS